MNAINELGQNQLGKLDPRVRTVVLRARVRREFLPECLVGDIQPPARQDNKHEPGRQFIWTTQETALSYTFLDSLEVSGFNYNGYTVQEDKNKKDYYIIVFLTFSRGVPKKTKDELVEDLGFQALRVFCCRSLWGMEAYRNPIDGDKFNIVVNLGARVDMFNPDDSYVQRWTDKRHTEKANIAPKGILSVVNGAITIVTPV